MRKGVEAVSERASVPTHLGRRGKVPSTSGLGTETAKPECTLTSPCLGIWNLSALSAAAYLRPAYCLSGPQEEEKEERPAAWPAAKVQGAPQMVRLLVSTLPKVPYLVGDEVILPMITKGYASHLICLLLRVSSLV